MADITVPDLPMVTVALNDLIIVDDTSQSVTGAATLRDVVNLPRFVAPLEVADTSLVLIDDHHQRTLYCTNPAGCSILLDATSITPGFLCKIVRDTAGVVEIDSSSTGIRVASSAAVGDGPANQGEAMTINVLAIDRYTVQGNL